MNRFNVSMRILVCSLLLAASVFAAQREQLYSLGFPSGEGNFDVIDGVPYVLRKGESASPGSAIDILDRARLVHFGTRKALAYPLDGDKPYVTMGGEGTSNQWKVGRLSEGSKFAVRATEGKFKDWYLDWSDEETELKVRDKMMHGRRLILVEKPAAPRIFNSYPVAP